MRNIVLVLLGILFLSCSKELSNKKSEVNTRKKTGVGISSEEIGHLDTTFYFRLKRGAPSIKFEYISSVDHERINRINIYDSTSGKLLQTIDSADMNDFPVQVDFDDYNFDGWIDLYIRDGCVILGNCHGIVLLYDSTSATFKRAHEYDAMTSIRTFPQKKIIYSINRSAGGAEYVIQTYRFLGGKMVLVESESQERVGEKYHYVLKRRDEDGKMIIVIDEYLEEPKL